MKTNKKFYKKINFRRKIRFWSIFLILFLILTSIIIYKIDLNLLKTQLVKKSRPMGSQQTIEMMKTQGCVFDGLLGDDYGGDFNNKIEMLTRTNCRYLHRAVETWNIPPNFKDIDSKINLIKTRTKKNFYYGFFIAESISLNKAHYYPKEKRNFNFNAMCARGTYGHWGKNTCKPSFASEEYQKYLAYITEQALDIGIEDFTFGQIYYQDSNWEKKPLAPKILEMMRTIAKKKGKEIIIGAQTNTIEDEKYLKNFDYITGGVGQNSDGYIEDGPCYSKYWDNYKYCWAMMWHPDFKTKANNVLVYLDWNARSSDDMNRYVKMSREKRHQFLGKAYDFFLWREIGFLFPLGAVLDGSGRGCYGSEPAFYSANNKYSCKDETAINQILAKEAFLPFYSRFVSQKIPLVMAPKEKYEVEIKMENTGLGNWNKRDEVVLKIDESADNVWGIEEVVLKEPIRSREETKFIFTIETPDKVGAYDFKWRMYSEKEGFFGQPTQNIKIEVIKPEN